MRRVCALVIGFGLLLVTPGLARADQYIRPASQQQAVDYVIARGLAQRGVPFVYGGGNASGPTTGIPQSAAVAGADPGAVIIDSDPAAAVAESTAGAGILGTAPAADVVGFDASGLIVYSFAGLGIKLPRSSGEQYKVGRKVPPALALPGDLIFYGPEGTQSVAMFVGNGQMLEATNPAVMVSPVRTAGMAPYLTRIIE
jgi:cell wall-associated NlpC family hydrolase